MFLGGAVQAVAAMLLWTFELAARVGGTWSVPAWPLPSPWWHALLLIFGVFPFFIFGFILTAGPRWQGAPETPRRVFVPAFLAMACGWALAYLGLVFPQLTAAGLSLVLVGWLIVLRWLWQVAARPGRDRLHIRLVVAALALGAVGLAAIAAFAAGGPVRLVVVGLALGLWGFLVPIFATVTHRMLPFFSSSALPNYTAYRADWILILLCAAALAHGALEGLGLAHWTWSVDFPAALAALGLTWRWNLLLSLRVRMVAVLHIAFACFGFAWLLYGTHSAILLAGGPGFGLAPLHALTIGFFSAMLVGMASRVALGHSGLPVAADGVLWGAFWAVEAAMIARVAGEWLGGSWLMAAALLWLAAFAAWSGRYVPLLLRPRADGKPG